MLPLVKVLADAKLLNFLHNDADVVANDFAENFVDHRHGRFAAYVIAEFGLDHAKRALDVGADGRPDCVHGRDACAVPCEPLVKIVRELGLPRGALENPYYFANKAIINVTAQHQREFGLTDPIDFIFDDQSEKTKIRDAWKFYVNGRITSDVRALTGAEPVFLNGIDHPALQAADLYAWWLRKAWNERGIDAFLHRSPFPWKINRDFPQFLMAFNEKDLRVELEKIRDLMIQSAQMATYQITVTFTGLNDQKYGRDFGCLALWP